MHAERDRISKLEARMAGLERRRWRARLVVVGGVVGALAVSSLAIGGVGDALREGVRNGTTTRETEIIGRFNATTGAKGGYVTRQSNTQTGSRAGGGAIYGCRGASGGTAGGSAPCLRATNLAAGYAFEFAAQGDVVGLFSAGDPTVPNPGARPFVTNATAVATGLNADKVDGLDAAQLMAQAQQGPAGPQGPQGDGKDLSEVGGVTQGFEFGGSDPVSIASNATLASSAPLPEGAYVVVGRVQATNGSGRTDGVGCRIRTALDGTVRDAASQNYLIQYAVPLIAAFTLPESSSVVVECNGGPQAQAYAKAVAVRLDEVD